MNDYERGHVHFPGNESGRLGNWIDGVQMARENELASAASKYPGGLYCAKLLLCEKHWKLTNCCNKLISQEHILCSELYKIKKERRTKQSFVFVLFIYYMFTIC